jgi:hypothetical protein
MPRIGFFRRSVPEGATIGLIPPLFSSPDPHQYHHSPRSSHPHSELTPRASPPSIPTLD